MSLFCYFFGVLRVYRVQGLGFGLGFVFVLLFFGVLRVYRVQGLGFGFGFCLCFVIFWCS